MVSFLNFRISLTKRQQKDIEGASSDPNRKDFLLDIFSKDQKFIHRKHTYYFAPLKEDSRGLILGRIGREYESAESLSPEARLAPTTHVGYQATAIIINPEGDTEGQKLYIEKNSKTGKSQSILRSFASHLNKIYSHTAFEVNIEPIFSKNTFWQWAKENEGHVTSIEFNLVAPNIFGGKGKMRDELKELREEVGINSIKIAPSNPNGLKLNNDRTKDAVDYASQGGGTIKAKAKGKPPYSSQEQITITTLDKKAEEILSDDKALQIFKSYAN